MLSLLIPVTNSAAALNTTTHMIQQQGRHDDGVPVVVIFLTDGISDDALQTQQAAENLHSALPQVKCRYEYCRSKAKLFALFSISQ